MKLYRPTLQKQPKTAKGYVACMTDQPHPADNEWNGRESREWVKFTDHAADLARADARIAELESAMQRQSAAVKMIDMSRVARAETMMQHAQVLHDQSNTAALESERQANALLTERIAELERECNSLRDFANAVMDSWPHGDVDGYDLERMAVDHGLLALKDPKPTEPCCDNCACSGYPSPEEWAEGIDCYVRTPLLKGDAARAGNGGEGE